MKGLTNLKQISLFKVSDLKGVLNITRAFYPTNLIFKGTPLKTRHKKKTTTRKQYQNLL